MPISDVRVIARRNGFVLAEGKPNGFYMFGPESYLHDAWGFPVEQCGSNESLIRTLELWAYEIDKDHPLAREAWEYFIKILLEIGNKGEKAMSKRKYKPGGVICSLDELLHQDFVFLNGKILHRGFFLSWSIHFILNSLGNGCLRYAVREEDAHEKKSRD